MGTAGGSPIALSSITTNAHSTIASPVGFPLRPVADFVRRLHAKAVVRRLPVLQDSEQDSASRPAWHYVLIGAGFTVTLWLPLVALALPLGPALAAQVLSPAGTEPLEIALRSATPSQRWLVLAAQALPLLLAFFLAAFASAALVGRFGGRASGRQAVLGNLLGSAVVVLLAGLSGGLTWPLALGAVLCLGVVSALSGWLGAGLGKRLRPEIS